MDTAREVLRYFLRNPKAVDSLEGIARFRIMDETVYRRVGEVSDAVEWLVAGGLLTASRIGRDRLFALNEEQHSKAEAFVHRDDRRGQRRKRT